jgi:hypothetical protein
MAEFIELTIDVTRNPLLTRPVTVNIAFIMRIDPREDTIARKSPIYDRSIVEPQGGGAAVTLSDGHMLPVVESYESLKARLMVRQANGF